jgi:hypothetical protein
MSPLFRRRAARTHAVGYAPLLIPTYLKLSIWATAALTVSMMCFAVLGCSLRVLETVSFQIATRISHAVPVLLLYAGIDEVLLAPP